MTIGTSSEGQNCRTDLVERFFHSVIQSERRRDHREMEADSVKRFPDEFLARNNDRIKLPALTCCQQPEKSPWD
jgi:hypothetical protein